ncbi:MAG: hypothetical protein C4536_01775 [Actinobacteria bacterium]|jgi:hypothetical protein|nr:MAG: hypothetical protein C4536_01775 [Actinomycetota bacterium]
MKQKAIKAVKLIGVVALVGFMMNSLLMLAQLKGLDSKLSENERLLSEAVRFEESMGAKGERITDMAVIFEDVAVKMETVNATARSIASDAADIRVMNDQLLMVNREIDSVILENIAMAGEIASCMSEVVQIMGDVGGLLGGITTAASQQLGKIGDMYRLAQENNAAVPALP